MEKLPKEIIRLIVDYSIEKVNIKNKKPHEFFILYYNINPFRALSKEYLCDYPKNPHHATFQPPVCLIC